MIATCTQKRRNFIEKDYQSHIDKDMETIEGLSNTEKEIAAKHS